MKKPSLLFLLLKVLFVSTALAKEVRISMAEDTLYGEPVIRLNVCGTLDLGAPLVSIGGDTAESSFQEQPIDFMGITSKADDESIKLQGSCQRGSQYPCREFASQEFEIPSNYDAGVTVDMRDCADADFRLLASSSPLLPWKIFGFDIQSRSPDKTRIEVPEILEVNATTLELEGSTIITSLPALGNIPATLGNLSLATGATCYIQWETEAGDFQRISLVVESEVRPCFAASPGTSTSVSVPTVSPPLTGPTSPLREFRLGPGCWCPRAGWLVCFMMALSFAVSGDCPVS